MLQFSSTSSACSPDRLGPPSRSHLRKLLGLVPPILEERHGHAMWGEGDFDSGEVGAPSGKELVASLLLVVDMQDAFAGCQNSFSQQPSQCFIKVELERQIQ